MTSSNIGLWNDVKSFAVNHYLITASTLGIAPVVYSFCMWAGRMVSWLIGLEGVAKKTDEIAKPILQQQPQPTEEKNPPSVEPSPLMRKTREVAVAKPFGNQESLGYCTPDKIEEQKGILLTKQRHKVPDAKFYCGIAALPNENGTYCLHLCPGGGNRKFKKKEVEELMDEALQTIVTKNISVDFYAQKIGLHPGKTLSFFTKWQATHREKGGA